MMSQLKKGGYIMKQERIIDLFKEQIGGQVINARAIEDPVAVGVWLIFATVKGRGKIAVIFYEDMHGEGLHDFEEVEYEEALRKYGK